jgi:L-lactate utilization protein LutC
LPVRGSIGRAGAGADLCARFCTEFQAAGGHAHLVADQEAASSEIMELVTANGARRILLGQNTLVEALNLEDRLCEGGRSITSVAELSAEQARDPLFAAELGISGVDYLIAETGTIVLCAARNEPRSLSLLPPVHIVAAERSQVLADLFDLFEWELARKQSALPSCVSLITGPSKTGDIELRLVTGVHGPGEIHVFLVG